MKFAKIWSQLKRLFFLENSLSETRLNAENNASLEMRKKNAYSMKESDFPRMMALVLSMKPSTDIKWVCKI